LTATGNSQRDCRNRETMSPAQLWRHPRQHEGVRELLAPTYSEFTEGFDTADLQEANALLDKWS
jgi:predicted ATPase